MTYDEVVNKVPYRNLIIMQRDKQHEATGEVVTFLSGAQRAQRMK